MKWTPNDKQREVLEALDRESTRDGSATDFIRNYGIFSYPKFSRILNAIDPKCASSYFDDIKDKDGLMEDLTEWLRKLPRLRLEREQASNSPLYKLTTFRAVAVSIRACVKKQSPERITKYISPTGGSKSTLRRYLAQEFRSELDLSFLECREAWKPRNRDDRKRADMTVLKDLCSALGVRLGEDDLAGGFSSIEDALVDFCCEAPRLLFMDEAEFFTKYALNLVKMLLNKTRLILVIACTPRAHTKWNCYYPDEADQIARRTHAVVQVSTISIEDAALFFPANQFENKDEALGAIVTAASKFGHYSLVARIADKLKRTTEADEKEVAAAIRAGLTQMARNGKNEWDGNRPSEVARLQAA